MAPRAGWLYGPAVVDGVPQYTSVSQLEMANDCARKWHYNKIEHKEQPKTKASIRGDNLHAEVERYLKTGDRSLSSLALRGMFMVPDPIVYDADGNPNMLVEQDMLLLPGEKAPPSDTKEQVIAASAWSAAAIARAPVRVDGIPLLGRMDLVHALGINKGGTSIEDAFDPPGTIEVCDWKSAGGVDYIKKPSDLPKLIQMAGYASWVYAVEPAAHQVRLSHGYFVEAGGPSRKVTLKVLREDVAPTMEHAAGVARMIRHAAAEPDVDRIDANTSACDKYGGCAHKSYCKASMHKALASFVGEGMARELIAKRQGERNDMGLLDKMKASAPAAANTASQMPTPTSIGIGLAGIIGQPAAPPAATPQPDPAAERAKLEAEEAALRAARAIRDGADRLAPILAKIQAYAAANPEVGMPSFAEDAAKFFSALCEGQPTTGSGKLGPAVIIKNISDAEVLVGQLGELAGAGQIKPAGGPATAMPAPAGLLAPDAPASQPAPLASTQPAAPAPEPAPEAMPKPAKKPAAAKKTEKAVEPTGSSFSVVIDAQAEGLGANLSFNPIFDSICAELAALGHDADLRAAGVRQTETGLAFAKDESPFTFGRAEGSLAAMCREKDIPPGAYYFDTRGNRMAEVAAAALADRCRKTGGFFVWGRR